MFARIKSAALSTLLTASTAASAMAQSAASSPASTQTAPRESVGAWLSGHPITDVVVVLAIIVVIAGTYFMRHRSRA
jgi:hypothetical protein